MGAWKLHRRTFQVITAFDWNTVHVWISINQSTVVRATRLEPPIKVQSQLFEKVQHILRSTTGSLTKLFHAAFPCYLLSNADKRYQIYPTLSNRYLSIFHLIMIIFSQRSIYTYVLKSYLINLILFYYIKLWWLVCRCMYTLLNTTEYKKS